jgi:hypothetical protein
MSCILRVDPNKVQDNERRHPDGHVRSGARLEGPNTSECDSEIGEPKET